MLVSRGPAAAGSARRGPGVGTRSAARWST